MATMRAPAACRALVPLAAAWCCHAHAAPALPPLPPSIAAQLPAGYQPFVAQQGPALGNGLHTVLVVVHRATDTREQPSPRPLLIYEEQADRAYRLAARNDDVVMRANDAPQCDPFDPEYAADGGIAVNGRYFTVQNDVACGQHWSDYVTFRYDAHMRAWLFSSDIHTESFPLDGKPDSVSAVRADPRKPVSFGAWKRTE
ncbi:lipoprotein [Burkholderia latens]|uniref:Lipoprotein n=2 Tax=Burkholderia latens TaxID=488446 RepID=A0A6P2LKY7_9BURK|nr:lipoprotein [Burkholderia latens]